MVGQVGTQEMSGSIANTLMFVFYLCIFGAICKKRHMDPQHRKRQAGFIHLIYLAAVQAAGSAGAKCATHCGESPSYSLRCFCPEDETGWDSPWSPGPTMDPLNDCLTAAVQTRRKGSIAPSAWPRCPASNNMPAAFFVADHPSSNRILYGDFMGCLSQLGCKLDDGNPAFLFKIFRRTCPCRRYGGKPY